MSKSRSGAPRRVAIGLLVAALPVLGLALAEPAGAETIAHSDVAITNANAPPGAELTTFDASHNENAGFVDTLASYADAARNFTGAVFTDLIAFEAVGFNASYAVMFAMFMLTAAIAFARHRHRFNAPYFVEDVTTMTQRWHQARAGRRPLQYLQTAFGSATTTTHAKKLTQTIRRAVQGTGTADAQFFAGSFGAA